MIDKAKILALADAYDERIKNVDAFQLKGTGEISSEYSRYIASTPRNGDAAKAFEALRPLLQEVERLEESNFSYIYDNENLFNDIEKRNAEIHHLKYQRHLLVDTISNLIAKDILCDRCPVGCSLKSHKDNAEDCTYKIKDFLIKHLEDDMRIFFNEKYNDR